MSMVFNLNIQDQATSHLGSRRLSSVDPYPGAVARGPDKAKRTGSIRLSAWELSRLDVDLVERAAGKARENSSVLHELRPRDSGLAEKENTSSRNVSSSVSTEICTVV
jgi:hypothetical protein